MNKSDEKKSCENFTRRKFMQTTAIASAAVSVPWLWTSREAWSAPVPAGVIADPRFSAPVIDPKAIPQFVTELPVPLTNWGVVDLQGGGAATIEVRELNLQVLPTGFNKTPVWGYRQQGNIYDSTFLGPTIIAKSLSAGGAPVLITYDYTNVPYSNGHILKTGNPAIAGANTVIDKHVHGTDMGEPEVRYIAHLRGLKSNGTKTYVSGYVKAHFN